MQAISLGHPLAKEALTRLRDKNSRPVQFRRNLSILTNLLLVEASKDLKLTHSKIDTPLETIANAPIIEDRIVLCSILRAGNGMLEPALKLFPDAEVGHIGLYRDEQHHAKQYYAKLPKHLDQKKIFLMDPMLATGGSALAAIEMLNDHHAKDITFISVLAAPEGIKKIQETHPDLTIICAAIDRQLDDRAYILPGLGDAGDRIFNTLEH